MQRDIKILSVNIKIEEICDQFAILPSWAACPSTPGWNLVNSSKPAEDGFQKLFVRTIQMNDIEDVKYWSKRPT